MKKHLLLASSLIALFACNSEQPASSNNFEEAYNSINEEGIKRRIATLASDDFMGRMPSTEGETKTINYLKGEFEKMGLKPGNGSSFFQEVPLVELTASVDPIMKITGGQQELAFKYWDDFVALTSRVVDSVDLVGSEMIFAGYGIVAPEYDWNDYEGLDVAGKTIVVLVNDPGFGKEDPSFFKGNEMTYYGRWTYKYEEAARQGAAGIIIVHETEPASYGFGVVQHGWSGPNMYLQNSNNNMDRCLVEGWISKEAAARLFANMGREGYDYYEEARKREFKAFPLNQKVSLSLKNSIKRSKSNNVLALYEGTTHKDEVIIYTAHWDHFGIGKPEADGDSIYNGAVDNGTGVAAIVQVAEAFSKLQQHTARSVLFFATTAEEQGLLGSAHYAANPVFAPKKTIANINVDAIRPIGKVLDFSIVGYGQSELEDYAKKAVEKQGRYITPDPKPAAGGFFRSDHFNFAKLGIPAIYGKGAVDSEKHGKEWGEKMYKEYTEKDYHKASDEYTDDFNAEGVMYDAKVYFDIGYQLASDSTAWPQWREGSEFKAVRER